MVIIQGLFGGITVLFFLPPPLSIIHGILAQTFFILTIIIAYSLSKERQIRIENGMVLPIRKGAMLMGLAVYIQLILGALMRHTASGLAIPDFPTMGGLWIPTFTSGMVENINSILFDLDLDPVSKGQIIIHFLHRFGAVVVTGIIGYFYVKYGSEIKENQLGQFTLMSIMTILVIQFSLGALTVLSIRAPYIASFHVVTGAALLGLCTLFLLKVNSLKLNEWKLK
jgi:cytochrome c oxidase assembly protein subunit 15